MKGLGRKFSLLASVIAIFLVGFFVLRNDVVFAQENSPSLRMKFFHLLNLVPGDGSQSTGSTGSQGLPTQTPGSGNPPLATPVPGQKNVQIVDSSGVIIGTGSYSAQNGYTVTIRMQIPNADATKTPFFWLERKDQNPSLIRIGLLQTTNTPGEYGLTYSTPQDLTDHLSGYVSFEVPGSNSPTPAQENIIILTQRLATSGNPTSRPPTTGQSQPTSGQNPQPTNNAPTANPTGGTDTQQDIADIIQDISESNIRTYLTEISNKAGDTSESQTRFSGTPGNIEEQAYIIQTLQTAGYTVDNSQSYTYTYLGKSITTKNIIARLDGQDPNSTYLVTAHMDSTAERDFSTDVAPGVDDNGSGTVAVMEIARAFKQLSIVPKHSVEFILFSGEEQGLHGSKAYVSKLAQTKKIRAVINLDMIGNIDPTGDCVHFNFKPGTGGNLISDTIVQVAKDNNIGLAGRSREWSMDRSDHAPFWSAGITTAIFAHECKSGADGGVYHSLRDKANALNVTQVTKAAKAVGGALVKMVDEGIGTQVPNNVNLQVVQQFAMGNTYYDSRFTLLPQLNITNPAVSPQMQYQRSQTATKSFIQSVHAAENAFILASVPFKDVSELEGLFALATTPIQYIMGEEVPVPQFIALFNDSQIQDLTAKGYAPRVIDNQVDLRLYVFLYHPQANQGFKLQEFGTVTEINEHYTFLKLAPGVTFSHQGVLGEFFELILPQNISPPPYKTARITLAPTPGPQQQKSEESGSTKLILLVVALVIMIGIAIGMFFVAKKRGIFMFLVLLLCSLFIAPGAQADGGPSKTYKEATIISIKTHENTVQQLAGFTSQDIVVEVDKNTKYTILDSRLPNSLAKTLEKGDKVVIVLTYDLQGKQSIFITDYKRTKELMVLLGIFIAVVYFVGRKQGLLSFIGMLLSFVVIIKMVVPQIILGTNPVLAALLGGAIIIPITFYLSHGLNRKTTIAIAGTLVSLLITGLLAMFFVTYTRLTGFADENAAFVQIFSLGKVDITSLLLAGIMIGAMGILDDITISQTSIVDRLRKANPKYTSHELYRESMIVGRDHIASLVNTLILVYAGASLPLFILFVDQNLSLLPVLNHEIIATEIVRTLVSSIGIVLAVPITTLVAANWKRV